MSFEQNKIEEHCGIIGILAMTSHTLLLILYNLIKSISLEKKEICFHCLKDKPKKLEQKKEAELELRI